MLQSLQNNVESVWFFALDHSVHMTLDISTSQKLIPFLAKALQQRSWISKEMSGAEGKSIVGGRVRKLFSWGQLQKLEVKVSTSTYACEFSKLICPSLINTKK